MKILVEIVLTSSRCPYIKILKIVLVLRFFWDAHRKFLYEDLVISFQFRSIIEGPAAAVAIMSTLICCCSIPTVACV